MIFSNEITRCNVPFGTVFNAIEGVGPKHTEGAAYCLMDIDEGMRRQSGNLVLKIPCKGNFPHRRYQFKANTLIFLDTDLDLHDIRYLGFIVWGGSSATVEFFHMSKDALRRLNQTELSVLMVAIGKSNSLSEFVTTLDLLTL
jgi:hypothetical protein